MSRLTRTYKDTEGFIRILEYVEDVPYLMGWHVDVTVPSMARRWRTEDGSIITLCDNWWPYLNIQYEDMRE